MTRCKKSFCTGRRPVVYSIWKGFVLCGATLESTKSFVISMKCKPLIWYKRNEQNIEKTAENKGFRHISCCWNPLFAFWLVWKSAAVGRGGVHFWTLHGVHLNPVVRGNEPYVVSLNPVVKKSEPPWSFCLQIVLWRNWIRENCVLK